MSGRGAYRLFWGSGDLRERDHLEDLDEEGTILLKWLFMKSDEGMDWIDEFQDRSRWRSLVNGVPYNAGNLLTSRGPVSLSGRTLLHGVIPFQNSKCSFEKGEGVSVHLDK
jgi:hypothetical protein